MLLTAAAVCHYHSIYPARDDTVRAPHHISSDGVEQTDPPLAGAHSRLAHQRPANPLVGPHRADELYIHLLRELILEMGVWSACMLIDIFCGIRYSVAFDKRLPTLSFLYQPPTLDFSHERFYLDPHKCHQWYGTSLLSQTYIRRLSNCTFFFGLGSVVSRP